MAGALLEGVRIVAVAMFAPDGVGMHLADLGTVERGVMSPGDFRDFVFTNPVRFYTDANPGFFDGTVAPGAVEALQASGELSR